MVRRPAVHPPWTTIGDLRAFFEDDHVHIALVVDHGELIGAVERSDLAEADDLASALDVATLRGRAITPDVPLAAALGSLRRSGRRRLAVTGPDRELLGLLCLKASGDGFCSDADVAARRREQGHRVRTPSSFSD
jgi:CBS domain-containing protein